MGGDDSEAWWRDIVCVKEARLIIIKNTHKKLMSNSLKFGVLGLGVLGYWGFGVLELGIGESRGFIVYI